MSGYVPLFDSLTKGTLCGRWPDIGLWPIVLSLSDKHGIVDVTTQYLASVTGLAPADITACLARFCEPDPLSRSKEESGARLILLDAHRDWGWRVVNHAHYREKARKAASDAARVASGAEAERKRLERETSRDVPLRPALSRPQTQTQTHTQTHTQEPEKLRASRSAGARLSEDWKPTAEQQAYAVSHGLNAESVFTDFREFWLAKAGAGARKADWNLTWRTWCRRAVEMRKGAPHLNGHATEAQTVYQALLESRGANRTPRVQAALERIGGWPRVQMRTDFDGPKIEREFCQAYLEAGA